MYYSCASCSAYFGCPVKHGPELFSPAELAKAGPARACILPQPPEKLHIPKSSVAPQRFRYTQEHTWTMSVQEVANSLDTLRDASALFLLLPAVRAAMTRFTSSVPTKQWSMTCIKSIKDQQGSFFDIVYAYYKDEMGEPAAPSAPPPAVPTPPPAPTAVPTPAVPPAQSVVEGVGEAERLAQRMMDDYYLRLRTARGLLVARAAQDAVLGRGSDATAKAKLEEEVAKYRAACAAVGVPPRGGLTL